MTNCNFIKEYIGNLEYVSNGLLSIINNNILINSKSTYTPTKNVGENCISVTPNTNVTLFDCSKWKVIKNLLLVNSEPTLASSQPSSQSKPGYLEILCNTLDCVIKNVDQLGHGLASQFERFACLCKSLKNRLDGLVCNTNCPDILGDFLCLLLQILTKLISAICKGLSLIYYSGCYRSASANSVVVSFFDCMACDFINDLCALEKLTNELNPIIIGFTTCNLQQCTPCYVAPCAPKKVRPMCSLNTPNYGFRPNCGCNCNKGYN